MAAEVLQHAGLLCAAFTKNPMPQTNSWPTSLTRVMHSGQRDDHSTNVWSVAYSTGISLQWRGDDPGTGDSI